VFDAYVSTGRLAPADDVHRIVEQVWADVREVRDGANSEIYPALAAADPEQFGLCVVGTDGEVFARGDADAGFAMMSVAKPFTFALVCAHLGADRARDELGANATGHGFNAIEPVLAAPDGRTNPMVNAGAIATCSRLPGNGVEEQWAHLSAGLSAFAGRALPLDRALYANVSATNFRNRELAAALERKGALVTSPVDALELYTRQSCLLVSARDLAVMGATLAGGGRNPLTREQVIAPDLVRPVLAVMATSGMYERSGDWLYDVGLPGKSGIGGGVLTVSPGKGGLGGFSPRLDEAGNSVRAVLAAARLARELGLGLFASLPS
jgi:glutaminase